MTTIEDVVWATVFPYTPHADAIREAIINDLHAAGVDLDHPEPEEREARIRQNVLELVEMDDEGEGC